MWALYAREVKRFQKIWVDTLFSPIVSIVLFLGVFGIVAGGRTISDVPYLAFVYAGLLSMMIVNSSFSSPSFALIISKNLGNIIDLQMAPIKPWAIGIAYSLAALSRGMITLLIAMVFTIWFIPALGFYHPIYMILGLILTGVEFGMLGVTFGFLAKSFESLTFMTTFIMQPMIFLAGVFYPVSTLPGPWSTISLFNPIHHNINLLRYSATNYADINPQISLAVILIFSTILFITTQLAAKHNLRTK
ncbi:MAG: ABC transporter permease [bacterium]|nr:ABC transporter permease [bacterium]